LKGRVAALDPCNGNIVWEAKLTGSSYVTVLPRGDHIFALTNGEAFCLGARNGERLWHNSLPGYGYGIGGLALGEQVGNSASAAALAELEKQQQVQSSSPASS
jgi:outer membrane protein assembly factor BamB